MSKCVNNLRTHAELSRLVCVIATETSDETYRGAVGHFDRAGMTIDFVGSGCASIELLNDRTWTMSTAIRARLGGGAR